MSTVANTLEDLQQYTLNTLKQAQKAFNKNPTSLNWYLLTRIMLTHQQAHLLRKDANVQHLLDRLAELPVGEWNEAIVQHALGMRIDQALA